ncbi:hypothetical protein F5Y18DRAFT_378597 [Xylariaceae sp. FL1019]|nr:hypothetical protein F5Y18DRAFT_378597 [Xylariaceae sp. FL1019]
MYATIAITAIALAGASNALEQVHIPKMAASQMTWAGPDYAQNYYPKLQGTIQEVQAQINTSHSEFMYQNCASQNPEPLASDGDDFHCAIGATAANSTVTTLALQLQQGPSDAKCMVSAQACAIVSTAAETSSSVYMCNPTNTSYSRLCSDIGFYLSDLVDTCGEYDQVSGLFVFDREPAGYASKRGSSLYATKRAVSLLEKPFLVLGDLEYNPIDNNA